MNRLYNMWKKDYAAYMDDLELTAERAQRVVASDDAEKSPG